MTAALAFPSTAGARTRQPMVFLHGLYPAGNLSVFEPADTSREMTVPSRLAVRASHSSSTYKKGGVARH